MDLNKLFFQFNAGGSCEHITRGVNIYLYKCVNLLVPVSCTSLSMCVCEFKSEH